MTTLYSDSFTARQVTELFAQFNKVGEGADKPKTLFYDPKAQIYTLLFTNKYAPSADEGYHKGLVRLNLRDIVHLTEKVAEELKADPSVKEVIDGLNRMSAHKDAKESKRYVLFRLIGKIMDALVNFVLGNRLRTSAAHAAAQAAWFEKNQAPVFLHAKPAVLSNPVALSHPVAIGEAPHSEDQKLNHHEISTFAAQKEHLENEIAMLKEEIESLKSKQNVNPGSDQPGVDTNVEHEGKLKELEKDLSSKQEVLSGLDEMTEKQRSAFSALVDQMKSNQDEAHQLESKLSGLKVEVSTQEGKLVDIKKLIGEKDGELRDLEGKIKELEAKKLELANLQQTGVPASNNGEIEDLKAKIKDLEKEVFSYKEPGIKSAIQSFINHKKNYDLNPLMGHITCEPIVEEGKEVGTYHFVSLLRQITGQTENFLSNPKAITFIHEVISKVNKPVCSDVINWILAQSSKTPEHIGRILFALASRDKNSIDSDEVIKVLNHYMHEKDNKDKFEVSSVVPARSLVNAIILLRDLGVDTQKVEIFQNWINTIEPFKDKTLNREKLFESKIESNYPGSLWSSAQPYSEEIVFTNFRQ